MGTVGVSRTSSVWLKRQAEYRDALGLKGVDGTLDDLNQLPGCSSFVLITARRTCIGCCLRSPSAMRGTDILRETATAEAASGLEERSNRRADPTAVGREWTEVVREVYALHYLGHVDYPNSRTEIADFVGERDLPSRAMSSTCT